MVEHRRALDYSPDAPNGKEALEVNPRAPLVGQLGCAGRNVYAGETASH